jgi:hypothetical protein
MTYLIFVRVEGPGFIAGLSSRRAGMSRRWGGMWGDAKSSGRSQKSECRYQKSEVVGRQEQSGSRLRRVKCAGEPADSLRLTADGRPFSDWQFAISPNRLASGFVHLAVGGASSSRLALVRLYDAASRRVGVWKRLLRNGAADLHVRHLAAGVCLVRVETDRFSSRQRLVVQRESRE